LPPVGREKKKLRPTVPVAESSTNASRGGGGERLVLVALDEMRKEGERGFHGSTFSSSRRKKGDGPTYCAIFLSESS